MNILFITPYLPYPPISGGRLQIFLRMKHLRKRGHSIFLMTFYLRDEYDSILKLKRYLDDICYVYQTLHVSKIAYLLRRALFYEIFPYNTRFFRKLREFIKDRRIDIAIFEGLRGAQYRKIVKSIPTILYEHNVESEIVEQFGSDLRRNPAKIFKGRLDRKLLNLWMYIFGKREVGLTRKFESRALISFDLCLACSERDAAILERAVDRKLIKTIPWCMEIPEKPHDVKDKEICNLVFVGSMNWEPNRDAVKWFVKAVYPIIKKELTNVRFIIAGSQMDRDIQKSCTGDGILVKGFVNDLSNLWLDTDIFIAPVRMGSGVNVKVLEAMSYGVPVITTSKGSEGINVKDGKHLLISNSPSEILHSIKYLIGNAGVRRNIGLNAREFIIRNHSTDKVIGQFEKVMKNLLDEKAQSDSQHNNSSI